MDTIDRKIIGELQRDGRISVTDLAARLPLSLSATSERLRRLQRDGIVSGFTVVVDAALVGRPIEALIDVRLRTDAHIAAVEASLPRLEPVVNAFHLTGRFDMQLQIAARDVAELDTLLSRLKDELGAEETNTRLVLRTIAGFPRPVSVG